MIYYQLGLYKGFYKKIEKMFISAKNGRHQRSNTLWVNRCNRLRQTITETAGRIGGKSISQ